MAANLSPDATTRNAMRAVSRFALRRRSAVEQRVIRMMRGDDAGEAPLHLSQFARLRDLAARNALVIHPPGTGWISPNELAIVSWLAQAQRVAGYRRDFHPDALLTLTVVQCAGTLDAYGINLPPLTLCHARRDDQ